ncbi:HAMP domain-containing histidine kinase [Candidatus Saccharibacteria bacterium]|nr:HAMP domain-containing histidine kinase [Candidatus Saccharibacteria bacterium]
MNPEVNGIFVAAHELKAPLSLMRQLALSLDPNNPKETRDYQAKMISVSERALKQVSDLSKIARLEDGLFSMEPVAIRGVCDEVTAELKYLFRFNSRQLRVKYTNRQKLVIANRDLLHSVIYNFCVNAIKYSDSSTISTLTVSDHKSKGLQSVRIVIRDFGPSLPMEIYQKLAKDQLEAPTNISFRPDSSGLGLYIATKFSRFMNANVGAIRHRDGTSFFVELPVSNQGTLFA